MPAYFTYSGNVYTDTSGIKAYPLVSTAGLDIAYLQKAYIHVYSSTDSGTTWNELSRPSQWDFDDPGTSAVLTYFPLPGEQIKVQRVTPFADRYISFQEGSLLTSGQLNEGEDFSLHVDQELADASASGIAGSVSSVRGTLPVEIDNSAPTQPVVELALITQAETELDPQNPSWQTDEKVATPGATERAYATEVGLGAVYPGAGNLGKLGKLRIDNVSAGTPAFYYWETTGNAWVQVNTKGDTGAQGEKGDPGPPPGLQTPATVVSNVPNNLDGSVGDATVSIDQDGSYNLQFTFGIPVGEKGDQGEKGETGSGVDYLGPADPTSQAAPANPSNGDFYVCTANGTAQASWAGLTTVGINDRLIYNSTSGQWDRYAPATSVIDLGWIAEPTGGTVTNTAGGNAVLSLATTTNAGLLSPGDKTKLDGVDPGAEVNVQADWSVTDTSDDAFIKNKPTIPTLVQSDWNQTNNAQPDYIKNKPAVLPDAPSDGSLYGRQDAGWVVVDAGVTSVNGNTGAVTVDLQSVCDQGATTTTGATFGAAVTVNADLTATNFRIDLLGDLP